LNTRHGAQGHARIGAVRIATLNLQHGGGNRVKALCEALDQLDADVLVLTEFRSGPRGEELTAWLRARGYCAVTHSGADARTNSVLVAARVGAISPRPLSATSAHAHRVAELVVGETLVVGAYFPGSEIKDRFWRTEFLPYMTSRVARRCLVLGDFNTGKHFVDESGSTFFSADCIDTLERAGWVDPWRARNPMAREYTWFSNVGNGFRLDHAYASPTLAPEVLNAWYDHGPRESHVTDHSALVVELVRMIP
jgi:exodeoxyribonuclease-3